MPGDAASLQRARASAYDAFSKSQDAGISAFRKNAELFSGFADAWNDLANALARAGQQHDYLYDEALRDYDRALGLDPRNPILLYNHAVTLATAGKNTAAEREAMHAGDAAPHDFDVQYFLGYLLGNASATGPSYGDAASAQRYTERTRRQVREHRARAFTDRLIQREIVVSYGSLRDRMPWTVKKARRAADAYAAAASIGSDAAAQYESCLLRSLADNRATTDCRAQR
jgi:tetratricopeptide (TPR) repeat protein